MKEGPVGVRVSRESLEIEWVVNLPLGLEFRGRVFRQEKGCNVRS